MWQWACRNAKSAPGLSQGIRRVVVVIAARAAWRPLPWPASAAAPPAAGPARRGAWPAARPVSAARRKISPAGLWPHFRVPSTRLFDPADRHLSLVSLCLLGVQYHPGARPGSSRRGGRPAWIPKWESIPTGFSTLDTCLRHTCPGGQCQGVQVLRARFACRVAFARCCAG